MAVRSLQLPRSGGLRRWLFSGLVIAAAIGGAGCAGPGSMLGDARENGLYRATRVAPTLEQRLTSARKYLAAYPNGERSKEVKAFFDAGERVFFEHRKTSANGLRAYLRMFPLGPHASEAESLLSGKETAGANAMAKAEAVELTIARESARRQGVRDRFSQWVSVFLAPGAFDRPLVEAAGDVIVPWALALPAPVCERIDDPGAELPAAPPGAARRCRKLWTVTYRATANGVPEERQALLEVAMWQTEEGKPLEIKVAGPDLFLRLEETVTARLLDGASPEDRIAGAARAVALVTEVVTKRGWTDRCKKTGASGVAGWSCQGIDLTVRAAPSDGSDDEVWIRPHVGP